MTPSLLRVREKVIASVPDIRTHENRCMGCGFGFDYCKCSPKNTEWYQDRPIQLADVLRAMEPVVDTRLDMPGGCWEKRHNLLVFWNLSLPLDEQSPETISFLDSLLAN